MKCIEVVRLTVSQWLYDYGEGLSEMFFAGIFGDREMVHKSEYCV